MRGSNLRQSPCKGEKFTVGDCVFQAIAGLLDSEGALGIPKKGESGPVLGSGTTLQMSISLSRRCSLHGIGFYIQPIEHHRSQQPLARRGHVRHQQPDDQSCSLWTAGAAGSISEQLK